MKKTTQKLKDLNLGMEGVVNELRSTFPDTYFKITHTSGVFIFTVGDSATATETHVTPEYILRYPSGMDIALLTNVIEKH